MKLPGVLVVTHGRLAEELVGSARRIIGDVEGLQAISIDWNDDVQEATQRIERACRELDRGRGVLLLTDMFGGTPTNLALSLHEPGRLEIVTGVNLPMLIKWANLREEQGLQETAAMIAEEARATIRVASQLLQKDDA
jgi:PTS system mannose-specific IIA component